MSKEVVMSAKYQSDPIPCDQLTELVADYAFGLTSPEEITWIEANLAECPDAVRELDQFRSLQANLRADVPQIDPPAALGERLLAAIAAPEAALTTLAAMAAQSTWLPTPEAVRLPSPSFVRPAPRLNTRWALIAAAVLVAIASNAFWIWQLAQSRDAQQQSVAQLSTQTKLLTLIAAGRAQKVELKAVAGELSAPNPAPLATLLCDPAGQVALLTVEHFPIAPPDKVYQLWMRQNGQPVNIGLFTVDANGAHTAVLMTPDNIANFEAAGITLEPLGGSIKPTGQTIVRGTLDYTSKN